MFVRFECGCIGLLYSKEKYICVEACDDDRYRDFARPTFTLRNRGPHQQGFEEVSAEGRWAIVDDINRWLYRGEQFEIIKSALNTDV